MTTLAADLPTTLPRAARAEGGTMRIEIAERLGAVEVRWRELEAEALATPYGRFDWVSAFAAAESGRLAVAFVEDGRRLPAAILPLIVGRRSGLRIARPVGGKHANFTMPLLRPDLAVGLDGAGARALLQTIGARLPVDILAFSHVPVRWDGVPNPFAAGGRASPDPAASLILEPDAEATLKRSMSGPARKKMRSKERGLAAAGTVTFQQALNETAVEDLLAAFLRQKAERFAELGIPDPFAAPALRAALRHGCLAGLAAGTPAIELFGIWLDGRPIAVLGGAADRHRFSGMFLSFENGDAARFSPGDLVVTRAIAECCARGRRTFDLGAGEARYKRTICDGEEELVDVVVPITALGRAAGVGLQVATELKRRAKADPRIVSAVAALRRRFGRS